MWLRSLFSDRHKDRQNGQSDERDPNLNRGVYYLYLILVMQLVLVFAVLGGIMFIGKVIATPWWMLLFVVGLGVWGLAYTYRKIKQQLRKVRDAFQRVDLSDRNYEISFMGGVFTMRVEQNTRQLLEAPPADSSNVVDADTIDTTTAPPRDTRAAS